MTTRTRKTARALACLAVAFLVGIGLLSGPAASAAQRTVRDKRWDAPAKIDITKATYVNGPKRLRARVKVRNLKHAGTMRFFVTQYATDEGFGAIVRYRHGRVRARLVHSFVEHVEPTRCKVSARWSARRDTISVHFSRRCLSKHHRRNQRNYVGASMWLGDRKYDFAPYKHVRHG